MPTTTPPCFAVDQRESGLDGVTQDMYFTSPLIGGTTRNQAYNTPSPGIHHPVENLIQCAIATISDDEIIVLFSGLAGQLHGLPTILFQQNVGFPTGCRQYGEQVDDFCHVLSIAGINDQADFLAVHT